MPTLYSQHFGAVDYQDDATFDFPAGLPGFEQQRRFLAIEHPASRPIVFLHCLERPDLCFITLPVLAVKPDYRLAISADDLHALGLPKERQPAIGQDVLCLAIISVAGKEQPTANLLAPLVINLHSKAGLQAIQEGSPYSHQHPVLATEPGNGAR
jgi:flagellar assembly factor FliW